MAEVHERLAYLEGRAEEQAGVMLDIRSALVSLEARVDQRFESVDRRFDAMDRRFEAVDRRFEQIDRRFEQVDQRFGQVDQRFERLEDKMSRQFFWLVGIQVTTLATLAAGLASILSTR